MINEEIKMYLLLCNEVINFYKGKNNVSNVKIEFVPASLIESVYNELQQNNIHVRREGFSVLVIDI